MEVQQAWQNAIENITNIQIENKSTQNGNDNLQDSQSMTQTQKLTENRPNWARVVSTTTPKTDKKTDDKKSSKSSTSHHSKSSRDNSKSRSTTKELQLTQRLNEIENWTENNIKTKPTNKSISKDEESLIQENERKKRKKEEEMKKQKRRNNKDSDMDTSYQWSQNSAYEKGAFGTQ